MLHPSPHPLAERRRSATSSGLAEAAEPTNLPQLNALREAVRELADRPELDEDVQQHTSSSTLPSSLDDRVAAALADMDRYSERATRRQSARRLRRLPRPQPFVPRWTIEALLSVIDGSGQNGQEHMSLLVSVFGFILAMMILSSFSAERVMLAFVFFICFGAAGFAGVLCMWLFSLEKGTENMQAVAGLMQECVTAYISVIFGRIYKFMVPIMGIIFVLYLIHGSVLRSLATSIAFALGACCSSSANIATLWICARSSIRVAHVACTNSLNDVIIAASKPGIIVGVIINVVILLGIVTLYALFNVCVESDAAEVPQLLLGFCLGTSYVATFAQLGGDIVAKSASISLEHFKQFEHAVPRDAHNPAVIADVVGHIIGYCCARSADFVQTLSCAVVGSMLLAGCLGEELSFKKIDTTNFVVFPIVMPALNMVVCTCAAMLLQVLSETSRLSPSALFMRSYFFALGFCGFFFGLTAWALLFVNDIPLMWWNFAGCGICGLLAACFVKMIMQQELDMSFLPGTSDLNFNPNQYENSVDTALVDWLRQDRIRSVVVPVAAIGALILLSCQYGRKAHSQNEDEQDFHGIDNIGLFGIAVATLGVISTLTYSLVIDVFLSVNQAASGITELSPDCPEAGATVMRNIRASEKSLRSFTKGFTVSSASLASFVLFRALVHIISRQSPDEYKHTHIGVDISQPEIFVGGTLGVLMMSVFGLLIVEAIGVTAQRLVAEVRREHAASFESPERRPDLGHFMTIVTRAALNEVTFLGIIAVGLPILIASFFKASTYLNGHPHLGAQTTIAYIICSTMAACIQSCAGDGCDKRPASSNPEVAARDTSSPGEATRNHEGAAAPLASADVTSHSLAKSGAGSAFLVLVKLAATVAIIFVPLTMRPPGKATNS